MKRACSFSCHVMTRAFLPIEEGLELAPRVTHGMLVIAAEPRVLMMTTERPTGGVVRWLGVYDLDLSDLGMVEAVYGPRAAEAMKRALSTESTSAPESV